MSRTKYQSNSMSMTNYMSKSMSKYKSKNTSRTMIRSKSKSKFKSKCMSMIISKSSFCPIKRLLVFPLFIMLLFIIVVADWNYDKYSDLRKRFFGYRNIVPDSFEMKKHNFIICGPTNLGKTTFINEYCSLYKTVKVFSFDTNEWTGYNTINFNELKLLENVEDFANSLIIFDDMGDIKRIPAVDLLYTLGRHLKINITCVGHIVTELSPKVRDNSPSIFNILNSSHLSLERVQEKVKIDSNLYRFKHYKYGVINYSFIVLYMILDLGILTVISILVIQRY